MNNLLGGKWEAKGLRTWDLEDGTEMWVVRWSNPAKYIDYDLGEEGESYIVSTFYQFMYVNRAYETADLLNRADIDPQSIPHGIAAYREDKFLKMF